MPSTFTDQQHLTRDTTPPRPRGLLPVPPEVAKQVEKEAARAQAEHGFTLAEDARRQMLNEGTLDWYYRDQWVGYRETREGVEILAVGLQEIGEFAGRLCEEEWASVQTKLV